MFFFNRWESDKPPEEVLTALVRAIEHIKQRDDTGAYYDIHKVGHMYM